MKKLMTLLVAGFVGLSLIAVDADARRLGGGRSLGKSYSQPAKPPAASPASPQQRQQTGAQSGASRWLGPLAGLAAGGLLAALLFGDAFDGLQFMDILLLVALAVGAWLLIRTLRRKSAPVHAERRSYAPAGGPAGSTPFETPEIGSGTAGAAGAASRPAWFDETAFLKAAKGHFIRLQAAWDKNDMEDIREYTTPELFAELTLERQEIGAQENFTEVVSLHAELVDFQTFPDRVVATVRYSGLIREERGAEPQPISELWHIRRTLDDPKADWYVEGIQQEELR